MSLGTWHGTEFLTLASSPNQETFTQNEHNKAGEKEIVHQLGNSYTISSTKHEKTTANMNDLKRKWTDNQANVISTPTSNLNEGN